jgi:hypothetical protein
MRFVFPMLLVVGLAGLGGTGLAGGTSPGRSSSSVAGGGARSSGGPVGRAGGASGAAGAPSGAAGQAWGPGGGGGAFPGGAPGSAPGWPAGLGVETPLVYRQAGYLGTIGPAPMRFGLASPGCNERTPPRVATTAKKTSEGAVFQPTVPIPPSNGAVGAVSSGEPSALGSGDPTVGVREQIMSFFAAPGEAAAAAGGAPGAAGGLNSNVGGDAAAELQRNRLRSLLDPVPMFQPAPPPPIPPSSATFRQN